MFIRDAIVFDNFFTREFLDNEGCMAELRRHSIRFLVPKDFNFSLLLSFKEKQIISYNDYRFFTFKSTFHCTEFLQAFDAR